MTSIDVRREFLNREECREEARRLLSECSVTGMSELQLAREIYFHALVYYFCERTGRFRRFKEHADPIDLDDWGDSGFRKVMFAAFWNMPFNGCRRKKQKER